MKIVPIFAGTLYSFKYEGHSLDEYERLFDEWNNILYLEEFFEKYKVNLQSGFYGEMTIEHAVERTISEASILEDEMLELAGNLSGSKTQSLDALFKPLDNLEFGFTLLSKQKAYGPAQQSWLRLYALKLGTGAYIITGGAIKLTRMMSESDNTKVELSKLERCRAYLLEEGLLDIDGFTELD